MWIQRKFTITAKADGAAAVDGLVAETPVVSGTENDTITIKGPRTVMNKIDSVVALRRGQQDPFGKQQPMTRKFSFSMRTGTRLTKQI